MSGSERFVRYLTEAHAAEVGYRKMFEAFIRDRGDQNLCVLYQEQVQLSRFQETRLDKCLSKYGAKPSEAKDLFNTVLAKAGDLIHTSRDPADQTVQDLLKAYGLAQAARAMYEALREYAATFGDADIEELSTAASEEKLDAANRIWPMIGKFAKVTLL